MKLPNAKNISGPKTVVVMLCSLMLSMNSCFINKTVTLETPFVTVAKLIDAERALDLENAKQYIGVVQVYTKFGSRKSVKKIKTLRIYEKKVICHLIIAILICLFLYPISCNFVYTRTDKIRRFIISEKATHSKKSKLSDYIKTLNLYNNKHIKTILIYVQIYL